MKKIAILFAAGLAAAVSLPANAFWGSWGGGPWYGGPWGGGPWGGYGNGYGWGGYPGYGWGGYPGYGWGGYPGYGGWGGYGGYGGYGYPGYAWASPSPLCLRPRPARRTPRAPSRANAPGGGIGLRRVRRKWAGFCRPFFLPAGRGRSGFSSIARSVPRLNRAPPPDSRASGHRHPGEGGRTGGQRWARAPGPGAGPGTRPIRVPATGAGPPAARPRPGP